MTLPPPLVPTATVVLAVGPCLEKRSTLIPPKRRRVTRTRRRAHVQDDEEEAGGGGGGAGEGMRRGGVRIALSG
jgi:hypothetical protein